MPSINASDITRTSDSTYFVDIARIKKFVLTYLREWQTSKRTESYMAYHKACRHANKTIIDSRSRYYEDRFVTTNDGPSSVTYCTRQNHWKLCHPPKVLRLCVGLAEFFAEKINNIEVTIKSSLANKLWYEPFTVWQVTGAILVFLKEHKIINASLMVLWPENQQPRIYSSVILTGILQLIVKWNWCCLFRFR